MKYIIDGDNISNNLEQIFESKSCNNMTKLNSNPKVCFYKNRPNGIFRSFGLIKQE